MARSGSARTVGSVAKGRRRPGPRKGASLPAGTRDDLLAAGAAVFAERGFDGATAEHIAERAGTTKAMINYHFRSKQGLYEAILLATFTALAARIDGVQSKGGSAPDKLRAFIAEFARAATEQPSFPAMMVREVLSGGKHLPEQAFLRIIGVIGVVRSIVEQGVAEGSFRPLDPLMTHLHMVGGLLFFFATEPFRQETVPRFARQVPPTAADFVAHVQETMVRGLAKDAAPRRRS